MNSVDAKMQANPSIRQTVSTLRAKLTGRHPGEPAPLETRPRGGGPGKD